jgi:uncharacterized protein (TIGR03000 family)
MYSLVLMMALTPSADTPSGLFNKGCNGCNGCSGSSCSGCSGCTGYSCSGCSGTTKHCIFGGRAKNCSGCSGCHGCTGCCGGTACTGCTGCTGGCAGSTPPPAPGPKTEKAPPPVEKAPATMAAPATIVVTLPADAKLTIDGAATRSISGVRTFVTPTLDAGLEFSYTLKAEVVRDGQTFSTEQRVTVRGGAESKINLTIPVTSASAQ